MIPIDPTAAVPLWKQIEDGVRRLVSAGALRPGAAAPSVRELARDLRINPATVAKAYQRLADAGVLAVRRGEGTFVADAPPSLSRSEKSRTLRDGADRYAVLGRSIGAADEEVRRAVDSALDRLDGGKR
jgi:GntR family transcriptional regulator